MVSLLLTHFWTIDTIINLQQIGCKVLQTNCVGEDSKRAVLNLDRPWTSKIGVYSGIALWNLVISVGPWLSGFVLTRGHAKFRNEWCSWRCEGFALTSLHTLRVEEKKLRRRNSPILSPRSTQKRAIFLGLVLDDAWRCPGMAKVWEPTETLRPDTGKAMGMPANWKAHWFPIFRSWSIVGRFWRSPRSWCMFVSGPFWLRQVIDLFQAENGRKALMRHWHLASFASPTFRWSNMVGGEIHHKYPQLGNLSWTIIERNGRCSNWFCGKLPPAGSNDFPSAAARRGAPAVPFLWVVFFDHPQKGCLIIEGSLEVKLPTIWTDEKQSRAEAKERERLEERRVEEKESEERRCRCAKR